jgi:hypothetical protein
LGGRDRLGNWYVFLFARLFARLAANLSVSYPSERPLREFEYLTAVSSSWNTETLLNAYVLPCIDPYILRSFRTCAHLWAFLITPPLSFIIKRCKLSNLLSLNGVPGSPPNSIGWVQHESKKGKWSKRFMEIRDGAVWLCKNDRVRPFVLLPPLPFHPRFDAS